MKTFEKYYCINELKLNDLPSFEIGHIYEIEKNVYDKSIDYYYTFPDGTRVQFIDELERCEKYKYLYLSKYFIEISKNRKRKIKML